MPANYKGLARANTRSRGICVRRSDPDNRPGRAAHETSEKSATSLSWPSPFDRECIYFFELTDFHKALFTRIAAEPRECDAHVPPIFARSAARRVTSTTAFERGASPVFRAASCCACRDRSELRTRATRWAFLPSAQRASARIQQQLCN